MPYWLINPNWCKYISELLTKYKKTLKDGSVDIGGTPEEVMLNFARAVRKRCLQNKAISADRPDKWEAVSNQPN